jgi:5'-nucleotidase
MRRIPAILVLCAGAFILVPPASAQEAPERTFTILVTNDDGYNTPGIRSLVDSLVPVARVVVAAPAEQQSGVGHGIRLTNPIKVDEFANAHGVKWYAVDARPATTVRLALDALVDSLPDLVVSGINVGDNLGLTSWISGTVAAAREAAFHGVPAIAVSMGAGTREDYAAAAGVIRELVERLRDEEVLQPGLLLNVNLPAPSSMPLKGLRVVRQSTAPNTANYEPRTSPRGLLYFWDMWQPAFDDVEGTDLYHFNRGYVTITPLKIDQTDEVALESLQPLLDRDVAPQEAERSGR